MRIAPASDLASIVRPAMAIVERVVVRAPEPNVDAPLAEAVATIARWAVNPPATDATRAMYRRVGLDPTKTRPSSEALLRRIKRGDPFPRVNGVVDVINWTSVETQLSFGVYDLDAIAAIPAVADSGASAAIANAGDPGGVELRLGRPGEEYAGIRKDTVHLAGRLTLADARGPFGNPTSDSARTMVSTATTRILIVVFAPAALATDGVRAAALTAERIGRYCR